MSAGVKAQEMSNDFCPKIHSSNAGFIAGNDRFLTRGFTVAFHLF